MTASRVRPALIVWLFAMLVIVVSGWVLLPFPRRPTGWEEIVWTIGFGMGFTTVGAILVDRRPREPVSRITLAIGLMVVAAVGFRAVAVALDSRPGDLPAAGALAAMTSQALQLLAFLTAGGFLLVRFPSGAGGRPADERRERSCTRWRSLPSSSGCSSPGPSASTGSPPPRTRSASR